MNVYRCACVHRATNVFKMKIPGRNEISKSDSDIQLRVPRDHAVPFILLLHAERIPITKPLKESVFVYFDLLV